MRTTAGRPSASGRRVRGRGLHLGLAAVLGLGAPWACSAEPPPPRNVSEEFRKLDPTNLDRVEFAEGEPGEPAVAGCADGQREGFADQERFPDVAGCLGRWKGRRSLRAPPKGRPCGDDLGPCEVPADVCAEGWHVCASDGNPNDVRDRLDPESCADGAGPGKFVAGMSHGQSREMCPPPPEPHTVFPCYTRDYMAEPVCCGQGCALGRCRDALWPGETRISKGRNEGCEQLTSAHNGGVMCCRDEA